MGSYYGLTVTQSQFSSEVRDRKARSLPQARDEAACAPQSLLAAARRWDDPVHSQIFDQLTVMIERVSWGKGGQEQTSSRRLVIPEG